MGWKSRTMWHMSWPTPPAWSPIQSARTLTPTPPAALRVLPQASWRASACLAYSVYSVDPPPPRTHINILIDVLYACGNRHFMHQQWQSAGKQMQCNNQVGGAGRRTWKTPSGFTLVGRGVGGGLIQLTLFYIRSIYFNYFTLRLFCSCNMTTNCTTLLSNLFTIWPNFCLPVAL